MHRTLESSKLGQFAKIDRAAIGGNSAQRFEMHHSGGGKSLEGLAVIGVTVWVIAALIGIQLAKQTDSLWLMIIVLILSALVLARIVYGPFPWLF
jgi:hypothetical protein